jgi:hypothetical protein
MRIAKTLFVVGVASVAIPVIGFALGMLLQSIIPGCGGDEGSGVHGCQVLFLDLSWIVGNLVLGGFVAAIFCIITVFPVSIVLGIIAAFFESAETPKREDSRNEVD